MFKKKSNQKQKSPTLCPYCEKPVLKPESRRIIGTHTRIYSCPHCNKILGIASSG